MTLAERGEEPEDVIERLAREVIAQALESSWSGPPFDPVILASFCGIRVEPADSDLRADARIIPKLDGSLIVQYNPAKPRTRTNFSICHELAHTFFPDCYETVRYRHNESQEDATTRQLETLCDLGAAELLMPHASFTANLQSLGTSLDAVRTLAKMYAASGEATLIRVSQLSEQPCAIVFLSEKLKPTQARTTANAEFDFNLAPVSPKLRVDYVRAIEGFDLFIPIDKSVPLTSACYNCLKEDDVVEAIETWDLDAFEKRRVQAAPLPPRPGNPAKRVAALVFLA